MKRIVVLFVVVSILFGGMIGFSSSSWAQGASPKAMEKASDEAVFHRVGDWFATRGKSDTEKKAILAERKMKRTAEKAQKATGKQMKKTNKEANNMFSGMKSSKK